MNPTQNGGNGKINDLNDVPGITLAIKIVPGQFLVAWPQVDDMTILGMLEYAKATLLLAMAKKQSDSRITLPTPQIVKAVS
jgi:hypothetical protein